MLHLYHRRNIDVIESSLEISFVSLFPAPDVELFLLSDWKDLVVGSQVFM